MSKALKDAIAAIHAVDHPLDQRVRFGFLSVPEANPVSSARPVPVEWQQMLFADPYSGPFAVLLHDMLGEHNRNSIQ